MTLIWPWYLAFFLAIPIIIGIYIWILRHKRKFAVRFPSISVIQEAIPRRSRWRQHLPFAFFLIGTASLITAMARPAVTTEVPLSRTTIILALDVSRSMCATDVDPNRFTVAQQAMLRFIEDQVTGTQIGIVAFARLAEIIVPPTQDKDVLRMAVANLTTSLGTAIGSATLKSIDAISEIANTHGPLPLDVAQNAADRQVRVYTIGFGTTELSEMVCTQEQLGIDAIGNDFGSGFFRGFGGGGRNFRQYLLLDEPTLRGVADITGGLYFRAESADQLYDIFLDLPAQLILQEEKLEVSVLFTAFGFMFILLAIALSLLWNRFP
jgi:Ca-activated chloride channel family protein